MFRLPVVFLLVAMLAYGVFSKPPGVQEAIDAAKAEAEGLKESAQGSAAALKEEAKAKAEALKEKCWEAAPEGVDKSLKLIIVDDVCTAGGVSWKIDETEADES
jgi:vacuolar-type H+-ATPase subunit H